MSITHKVIGGVQPTFAKIRIEGKLQSLIAYVVLFIIMVSLISSQQVIKDTEWLKINRNADVHEQFWTGEHSSQGVVRSEQEQNDLVINAARYMIKFGSANPHLPSSYTLIHEMATGTGVYKVHTVLFMTILFGGWTLLLFVLASVNRQMLWQKVRYR